MCQAIIRRIRRLFHRAEGCQVRKGASLLAEPLSGADLGEADLSGTDLSGTNLRGATGVTDLELERQARSLEGATMPNGQKYEDWLKDKGSREDGETQPEQNAES
jgi:uncharacterized protein YjbI with pentapeptide repeats